MGVRAIEDTIKAELKDRRNAHVMVVDGMSKLMTHKVKTCESSIFQVSGHKWKMIVHPAGEDGTKDYLSFHLRIKDKQSLSANNANWEVTCRLKLSVVAQTESDMCCSFEWPLVRFNAKNVMHGKDSFMSYKMLKENYLVNDKVIFSAEVTNVGSNCGATNFKRAMGTAERLKLIEVPRNQSRFTWKITQFSSFDGIRHGSYEFTVGPRRWKLEMIPKGGGSGKGNSLSLFLKVADCVTSGPMAKTLAVYKTRVWNQLRGKHHEINNGAIWFHYDSHRRGSGWGRAKFLPLEKLNDPNAGFLLKDEIYIGVEFSLVSVTEYL